MPWLAFLPPMQRIDKCEFNLLNLSRKGSFGNSFGMNLQRNDFVGKKSGMLPFWRIGWFWFSSQTLILISWLSNIFKWF